METYVTFGFYALDAGQLEFDDTDNAILLPEIDVALADGITFHPFYRPTRIIQIPPNGAAV